MNKFYATYSSNIFFFFKILKPANRAHVDLHLDQGISKLHFMQKDKTYITSHLPIVLQHPPSQLQTGYTNEDKIGRPIKLLYLSS